MKSSLCLLLVALLIAAINARPGEPIRHATNVDWPLEFEGSPLEQLPLSKTEQSFANSFPGAIAAFRTSNDQQLILRRSDRATRKLHDSATCLRAAGFSIGEQKVKDGWLHYEARKDYEVYQVRERIRNTANTQTWTEVSAWFWHASFNQSSGPWMAETVLTRG